MATIAELKAKHEAEMKAALEELHATREAVASEILERQHRLQGIDEQIASAEPQKPKVGRPRKNKVE